MAGRNVIDAGRHAGAEPRNVGRIARQIRAHVGDDVDIEREERPLSSSASVAVVMLSRPWLSPRKCSVRSAIQFTGLPELSRRDRGQRIFAIGEQLGAEAAADIGRDDAHLVGRQT